jgi:thiamine biosynthesis lipoprotein
VQAVTVLISPGAHAGTLSDVASKPIFIAGVTGWQAAAQKMGVDKVMLIDATGKIHMTAAMQQRLNFKVN